MHMINVIYMSFQFISKYQLNVPSKERMTEFLRKENEGLYKRYRSSKIR